MRRFVAPTLALLFAVAAVGALCLPTSSYTRSTHKASDSAYQSTRYVEANHIRATTTHKLSRRELKGHVGIDDYQPVDPSPSSKATVKAGPIEHGAPLLPYVPPHTPPPGIPGHLPPAHSPASPVI